MEKHPHAPAIERISRKALMDHFHITRQSVGKWTTQGVPPLLMSSVRTLAAVRGVHVPELYGDEA